jgi:hypothetical protein
MSSFGCAACGPRNEGCVDGCVESAKVCNTIFDGHPNRFAICNGIRRGCDQRCTDAQDYNGVIQRCQRALCGRQITTMGTDDSPLSPVWAKRSVANPVPDLRLPARKNFYQRKNLGYGTARSWVPTRAPRVQARSRTLTRSYQPFRNYTDSNCRSHWPLRNFEEPEGDCPTWCRDSEQELAQPARRSSYGYNYAQIPRPGISAANDYMPGLYDEQGQGCYRKQWAPNDETCRYFD